MKIVIFGGRDLTDPVHYEAIIEGVERSGWDVTEVVSGEAPGIDALAIEYANEYKLDLTKMPANWNGRGKAAGPHRNTRMALYADAGMAIPGPDSRGTYHMIAALKKLGKPVKVLKRFTFGDK